MAKTRTTTKHAKTAAKTPRRTGRKTSRKAGAAATRATVRTSARLRLAAKGTRAAGNVDGGPAHTIVYIHGIGNKPEASVLRCQWDHAVLGFGLGERSRMAYWCQADRHGPPEPGTCADADAIGARSVRVGGLAARAIEGAVEQRRPLTDVIAELTGKPSERAALTRLLKQIDLSQASSGLVRQGPRAKGVRAEGLGDINFPNPLTQLITGLFLKDVSDFFFSDGRRQAMKDRLMERLNAGNGPFVLVAHSQGTMIAYSALMDLPASSGIDIAQFITIGSPLGLSEVREQLRRINGLGKGVLPTPPCVRQWLNVFDPFDPVAQNEPLAQHYRGDATPNDVVLENPDGLKDAHSATGYLRLPTVQLAVRENVDLQRFQRLAPFVMAADVASDFEKTHREDRRPLLIELTDPAWARAKIAAMSNVDPAKHLPDNRADMATQVARLIAKVTDLDPDDPRLELQRLSRYVSVKLTEDEAQRLASRDELNALGLALPPLYRIWRNAKKVALLDKSIHLVQAAPAHQAYQATGQHIQWAVLDSGCTPHPHFDTHDTIVARWDCTKVSDTPVWDKVLMQKPGHARKSTEPGLAKGPTRDHYGHGTHVAGIIAGAYQFAPGQPGLPHLTGIAPDAKLHIYKVLDNEGSGDDAWIIKALDHIASINEKAGGPEIAGVNLSLGGEFEQGVFGCGHTPLCDELRRLWRQGVVVVLAAGNEGYRRLMSTDGDFGANIPCSIGDPANLEESIAVGAVHKEKPHTYGVSHFSSRGPTADGRNKPDCVAPGEQILSCRHDPKPAGKTPFVSDDLYYKLDGTSMAAPHVSGLIACYLSLKREFIGQPDKVKQILIANCTDLGRDRDMQGAGLPNLVKMLVQS